MKQSIAEGRGGGWEEFPKKKIFISFSGLDRNRMEILKGIIESTNLFYPVIVEKEKRRGGISQVVIQDIKACEYFLSILTMKSIKTQWINQEIGFSFSIPELDGKRLIIVERSIINRLSGFITKDTEKMDYIFEISEDNSSFIEAASSLMDTLVAEVIDTYKIEPV